MNYQTKTPYKLMLTRGLDEKEVQRAEIVSLSSAELYDKGMLQYLRFPKTQALVNEIVEVFDVDIEMAWGVVLLAISIVLQGLIDVEPPYGSREPMPVSLFVQLVAGSGERKSAVINSVLKVIREFERGLIEEYEQAIVDYKRQLKAFEKGKLEEEPVKPKSPIMLHEDCTLAGLFDALENTFRAIAVVTAEGGGLKNSVFQTNIATTNAVLSGEGVRRKTKYGFVTLDNVRLAMLNAIQPQLFFELLKKRGNELIGSGNLPRSFFVLPDSRQGGRRIKSATGEMNAKQVFDWRMRELLQLNLAIQEEGFQRRVTRVNEKAEGLLLYFAQDAEHRTCVNGDLRACPQHANRLAEQAMKIAALLHEFEGFGGDISLESLEDAIKLTQISTSAFKRISVAIPPVLEDAKYLMNKFLEYRSGNITTKVDKDRGYRVVSRTYIKYFATNRFRCDEERFVAALRILKDLRFIVEYKECYPDDPNAGEYIFDLAPELGPHTLPVYRRVQFRQII